MDNVLTFVTVLRNNCQLIVAGSSGNLLLVNHLHVLSFGVSHYRERVVFLQHFGVLEHVFVPTVDELTVQCDTIEVNNA